MSKTNCINCGAAKDTEELRCPFCGTTYLDFTAIDFTTGDPVVCEFVLPYAGRTVVSMLARPMLEEISMRYNTIDVTSFVDTTHKYVHAAPEMNFQISFDPVMQKDGTMLKIRQERDD